MTHQTLNSDQEALQKMYDTLLHKIRTDLLIYGSTQLFTEGSSCNTVEKDCKQPLDMIHQTNIESNTDDYPDYEGDITEMKIKNEHAFWQQLNETLDCEANSRFERLDLLSRVVDLKGRDEADYYSSYGIVEPAKVAEVADTIREMMVAEFAGVINDLCGIVAKHDLHSVAKRMGLDLRMEAVYTQEGVADLVAMNTIDPGDETDHDPEEKEEDEEADEASANLCEVLLTAKHPLVSLVSATPPTNPCKDEEEEVVSKVETWGSPLTLQIDNAECRNNASKLLDQWREALEKDSKWWAPAGNQRGVIVPIGAATYKYVDGVVDEITAAEDARISDELYEMLSTAKRKQMCKAQFPLVSVIPPTNPCKEVQGISWFLDGTAAIDELRKGLDEAVLIPPGSAMLGAAPALPKTDDKFDTERCPTSRKFYTDTVPALTSSDNKGPTALVGATRIGALLDELNKLGD